VVADTVVGIVYPWHRDGSRDCDRRDAPTPADNDHEQSSRGAIRATGAKLDIANDGPSSNQSPKAPAVLSQEEVARFLEAVPGLINSPMIQNDKIDAARTSCLFASP
jgi:hypothetical protein